jgi:hypothetical protein
MTTVATVLKPLDNETTAAMGFISNDNIDAGVTRASLSPQVFGSIKLKRIVASQMGSEPNGPVDNIIPLPDTSEVVLGSGGPVSADAANYAVTAYYALSGGAVPVAIAPEHYSFAPAVPYFINSDLSLSVIGENAIRVEDMNLIPQDLVPVKPSEMSVFPCTLDAQSGLFSYTVATASSPCGSNIAALTLNPLTVSVLSDANLTDASEYNTVAKVVLTGVSSSAPEYQLEYVADDIVFVGLRNSATGYWVNLTSGVVRACDLTYPLISCHTSTTQFGVPSVVVAVISGSGFDIRLCVFGDASSAPLLSRTGQFGDLFLHGDSCMLAASNGSAYYVETIRDFDATEHIYTGARPNFCFPRKIFACEGEVLVMFASSSTSVSVQLLHTATNTFVTGIDGSSAVAFPALNRVRHLPSHIGHLFYCGSGQPLLRITKTTEPIAAVIGTSTVHYPSLLRGIVVGFNFGVPKALIQNSPDSANAYIRVLTNQPETGLVLPYPELYITGSQTRIYPSGANGYYAFSMLSSSTYKNVGIAGLVDRQGQKYVVQLIAYDNLGYIEPVLTAVTSDFIADSQYPDGAVIINGTPVLTPGYSSVIIDGIIYKVLDPGYFRYQPGWLDNFSTHSNSYGLGYPNPYNTELYTNWDCSVAVLHKVVNNINPTTLEYLCIAVPGAQLGSIVRSNDLSVDTMDVNGTRTPVNSSGEIWFGYLPGATQTLPNSGGIFSFSSVIDTNN